MTDFSIRRAQKRDEVALARLWGAMIAELRDLDPHQPTPVPDAATIYAARLMNVLNDPGTRVFVAEADGDVIGFCLGALVDLQSNLFVPAESGLIVDLFVDQAVRRGGIGRALVTALMDWFKVQGAAYVELNVASANTNGRAFWHSAGGSDYQVRMRIEF